MSTKHLFKYFKEYDCTFQLSYDQGIFRSVEAVMQGKKIETTHSSYQHIIDFNSQLHFLQQMLKG